MALNDLNQMFSIVDPNTGKPTDYLMRLLRDRGVEVTNIEELVQLLEQNVNLLDAIVQTINGTNISAGVGLSGGGVIGTDDPITLALNASIDDLTDVDTSTTPPTDQQALLWDDANQLWVPGTVSTGGGGGGGGSSTILLSNSQGIDSAAVTTLQVLTSVVIPANTLSADNDYIQVDAGFWRANAGSRSRLVGIRLRDGTNTIDLSHSVATNNTTTMFRFKFLRVNSTAVNVWGEWDQATENIAVNGSGWLRRAGARTTPNTTFNWSVPVTLEFYCTVGVGAVVGDVVLGHAFADLVKVSGGGGGGGGVSWWFNPPAAASLNLSNTGGTNLILTDDADAGLLVDMVNMAGADQTRRATRTLTSPSLDWDFKTKFALSMCDGSDLGFGIVILGPTNDQVCFNLRGNQNLLLFNRNAAGTFGTLHSVASATENTPIGWLRAQRVGASMFFYVSAEGKLWKQIGPAIAVTNLSGGPNRVGFSSECNSTSFSYVTSAAVENFDLSGPAV